MKLNHDCVRSIMIHVEENLHYGQYISFNDVKLDDYTHEEILYAADKLLEVGYFEGKKQTFSDGSEPAIRVTALSWVGHQFLDNIRDDGVWKDTKKVLSKFSSVSLSFVGSIASQVITTLIQNQLGQPGHP